MRFLRALAASFSYFSIFPGKTFGEVVDGDAIALLPIVGIAIGAVSGLCAYGLYGLSHSSIAAAIVAWLLSIALSGAIHVDGFLDCCDGLFAMATPERRLEIMRDPHHGTYAIVGMVALSVVWLYALLQIPPQSLPWVLTAAAAVARLFGSSAAGGWLLIAVSLSIIVAGIARILKHGVTPFDAAMIAAAVALAGYFFAKSRLNGKLNGDCYGAIVVVAEVAMLLMFPLAGATQ